MICLENKTQTMKVKKPKKQPLKVTTIRGGYLHVDIKDFRSYTGIYE